MVKRRNAITGQWMARAIELLEGPAYRVLSLSAHRALSRIEIELAHHGGRDNGDLRVRFEDFEAYGVRRHSIGPALNELEALGFIKITEHGKSAKSAEYRRANKFLLTTRPELVGLERCGWRRFNTAKEAEAAIAEVRYRRSNLKAASAETAPEASAETAPNEANRQCRNGTTMNGRNGTTIYISGRDEPSTPYAAPTSGLATPPIDDAPTLNGVFPSKSPATHDAQARLVWTRPIVRELFGDEARARRAEVAAAEPDVFPLVELVGNVYRFDMPRRSPAPQPPSLSPEDAATPPRRASESR
jgi:hypothetical protein